MYGIKKVFKAYDIRGVAGEIITPAFAQALGKAFTQWLCTQAGKPTVRVAIAHDMRVSSPELFRALAQGLLIAGADVIDEGLLSTPAFYFGVGEAHADGGIMVSASHNPALYNGFKLTRAHAVPVGGETGLQDIAEIMEKESFQTASRAGARSVLEGVEARFVFAQRAFAGIGTLAPLRLVADAANGMGAQYLGALSTQESLTLDRLYFELDGSFPHHEADPLVAKNLLDLQRRVVDTKADLGIATDGDGDRIFFVDEKGELIPPAIIRGLLASILLRRFPGAKICYDVRPGRITQDMILAAGGQGELTRVGHSLIKQQMLETGAVFGGESSGHFFYALPEGVFEGPVVALLHLLYERTLLNKPFSEMVAPYKKYAHSGEINFRVQSVEEAFRLVKEAYPNGERHTLDGLSITYPTYWFNIRASNTEPLLRLNLEAINQTVMEKERDRLRALLSRA